MQSVYDIIIIGGGTAGCVLANRLSEDPTARVLLLEAGGNRSDDLRVLCPGETGSLVGNADFDWKFETEPQPGLDGRIIKQPRGKILGGSSGINSFALIYPSVTELDTWASLGSPGWDSKGILPYLKKFQTICQPAPLVREELSIDYLSKSNETSGPIQATFPLSPHPVSKAWIETFEELHLKNSEDPCSGRALGGYISSCHISNQRSERSYAGNAYIDPVLTRENLYICTGAHIERILFDNNAAQEHTAVGVSYRKDRQLCEVRAGREVVLAAGAFASPQILELSGFGNRKILENSGIEVIYENNAIGENLQDHVNAKFSFESIEGYGIKDLERARKEYRETRTGPLADNAVYTFANMPLMQFLSSEEQANLHTLLDSYNKEVSSAGNALQKAKFSFIRNAIESPSQASATAFMSRSSKPVGSDPGNYITLAAMLSHSFSTGSTHIQSSAPGDKPLIDSQYLSHPLDAHILGYHMRSLQRFSQTPPFSKLLVPNGRTLPRGHSIATVAGAERFIKECCGTNYHPCGSCAMLPEGMGGVVDERLRVYGTTNLRIVDASVFPIIPRGNIITMVYAVAEKGADIIASDLGIRRTS